MIVGITGGSGTGKSTACRFFEEKGWVIIDADSVAREVCSKGTRCLREIKAQFGDKIIDENGKLIATSSIFDGDSTKAKLTFDTFNVSDLNGKVFRIEFTVKGKLYSFGFADKNGDFGGAHAAGMVK